MVREQRAPARAASWKAVRNPRQPYVAAAAVAAMPKFTKESSAFKGKCYFCKAEIMVPTGPGWNSTRVICRACSLKQGDAVDG
jgi:hypothetical protein